MKRVLCFAATLALLSSPAWAATKPAAKSAVKPSASAPVQPAAVTEAPVSSTLAPETQSMAPTLQVDAMTPGLSYNFLMDMKLFDMANSTIQVATTAPDQADWYMYSTYRAIVANVFRNGIAILADIEKPGYAGITYPTLKVNELYAKYKQGIFYAKVGRQVVGSTDDLLLGFQNDAVALGFDLNNIDLSFFLARPELFMPWQTTPTMNGLFGAVPTFYFGSNMGLKAYLLVGTEEATVTPAGGTSREVINSLIHLGAKYFMDMPVGASGNLNLAGQLGIQAAMARNAADQSIDATGVGLKLDGGYSNLPENAFGFKVNGHIVYTSGTDLTPLGNTPPGEPRYGFFSNNALVGSGPGLFSKIQDGAGPFTYLDSHSYSQKFQQYAGVFAGGATADFFVNAFQFGGGVWAYADTNRYTTNPNPTFSGMELDQWVVFRMSKMLSFYQQFAYFVPAGFSPAVTGQTTRSPMKFVLGTSLTF